MKEARQLAERRLGIELVAVWLFAIAGDHRGAKQTVSYAIALAGPCHAVIDHIGVYGAVLADLSRLDPVFLPKQLESVANRPVRNADELGEVLLAYDNSIMLAELAHQQMHHTGSISVLCYE